MRSVTQDGVFSLLSAGVSLVALLGSLINLLTETIDEEISADFNITKYTALKNMYEVMGGAICAVEGAQEELNLVHQGEEQVLKVHVTCDGVDILPPIVTVVRYPHAWVENVLTLLIGLMLFFMGLRELFYSTRVLRFQWWKARFWCASASREELDGVLGDLSLYADTPPATLPATESTPLKT